MRIVCPLGCVLALFGAAFVAPAEAQKASIVHSEGALTIAASDSIVLAITESERLVRSVDHGLTWEATTFVTSSSAVSVVPCPNGDFVAGTYDDGSRNLTKLYEITDRGTDWTSLFAKEDYPWDLSQIRCLESGDVLVAEDSVVHRYDRATEDFDVVLRLPDNGGDAVISGALSDKIWVGYTGCADQSCGGLYYSTDAGESFTRDTTWSGAPVDLIESLDSARVIVANRGLAMLLDDGAWQVAGGPVIRGAVRVAGDMLFSVTDLGVYFSTDAGMTWNAAWNGSGGYDIALAGDSTVLAATWTSIVRVTDVQATALSSPEPFVDGFDVQVYPNPVRSRLETLPLNGMITDVEVVDLTGRVVLSDYGVDSEEQFSVDVSRLPAGVYFVRARSPDRVEAVRMFVKL